MSETPEVKGPSAKALCPTESAALNEAAWQKWLDKNKERDAQRRKKLIRLLWLMIPSVFAIVWWLTFVSK
jgi:hypothetical protein